MTRTKHSGSSNNKHHGRRSNSFAKMSTATVVWSGLDSKGTTATALLVPQHFGGRGPKFLTSSSHNGFSGLGVSVRPIPHLHQPNLSQRQQTVLQYHPHVPPQRRPSHKSIPSQQPCHYFCKHGSTMNPTNTSAVCTSSNGHLPVGKSPGFSLNCCSCCYCCCDGGRSEMKLGAGPGHHLDLPSNKIRRRRSRSQDQHGCKFTTDVRQLVLV